MTNVKELWHQKYEALTDYIATHPEIKISPDAVSIPGSARTEFYQLFNSVRTTLLEDKIPDYIRQAKILSQNYLKAEEEVATMLGLEEVSNKKSLQRFLHDPVDGLANELFDQLYNLLKGKTNIKGFEVEAAKNTGTSFRALYRLGYEKWAALSMMKLLEPDKLFQVTPRPIGRSEHSLIAVQSGDNYTEQVPSPQVSKHLSFDHYFSALFTIPDFIVHSTKADKYIALRSEMNQSIANASNPSKNREWYPLDSIELSGFSLVYIADNPEDIALVADMKKICRPDLIIVCRGNKDWFEKEGLENIKLRHESLKPRLGTYIVSREPASEQVLVSPCDTMYILSAGYDQPKLKPIVNALISTCI